MKIAILSESPADEAAVHILVQALVARPVELVAMPPLRTRGWPSVRNVLPGVLSHLHYQTDAEALAVVVDCDDSTPHQEVHERPGPLDPRCRLCSLVQVVTDAKARLRCEHRPAIKTAIGLAVPAIEAWLHCGRSPHTTEAALIRALVAGRVMDVKNRLKRELYGTDRPSLADKIAKAREEATRLAADVSMLERLFPAGFGDFARACRGW